MSVRELFIYPVKSLAGIPLTETVVEERGLRHDRRWMIVDRDNVFITQRDVPKMATVKTAIGTSGILTLSAGGDSIIVPAYDPAQHGRADVRVWDSTVPGAFPSRRVDEWLSDALSVACRLVFMPEDSRRGIDPAYALGGEIVSFADGYPILLGNVASLHDLNARAGEIIPMDRFRPNVVMDGMEPFAEDLLGSFRLGTATLEGIKPCARCSVTTVDQHTGERTGKEPLKTLATFRKRGQKVDFGENLVVRAAGIVRVGDELTPLAPRGVFPRAIAS